MAAIVSGGSLGILQSSLAVLGGHGQLGSASHGRATERVYVNAATGNLVFQGRDEVLIGKGADAELFRTYNSQGLLDDDNGDNWRFGFYRRVHSLSGTLNTAGSKVWRTDADGAEAEYTFENGRYVTTEGDGAYDTLTFDNGEWTWTDGLTGARETYDSAGRLIRIAAPGETGEVSLTYSAAGLLTQITTASGDTTVLEYVGSNVSEVRTTYTEDDEPFQVVRTRYAYDELNRLRQVITDLTPQDENDVGATYVTSYSYHDSSRRVASMTQTDGTSLSFTYIELAPGDWRVASITEASSRVTTFDYDVAGRTTTVEDPLGHITVLAYDADKRLTSITMPPVAGAPGQQVSYAYDAKGNVVSVTDAKGNAIAYVYDDNGNRIREQDAAGNVVERRYDADSNRLLLEIQYLSPDPDGAGAGGPSLPLTTRYVYDAGQRLRFVVAADGGVTEHRYDPATGERISTIHYGERHSLAGLDHDEALGLADMVTWLGSVDVSDAVRVDMEYHPLRGHLDRTTTYARVDASGDGVKDGTQAVTQFIYDQAGNLLSTISPGNRTTSYTYDGLGRLETSVDALGQLTVIDYQDLARKTVVTLANGLVRTSTYSAAGELIGVLESAEGIPLGETKYFYDENGRLVRTEDPTGVKTHFLYDEVGRKVGEIDGDGSLTEYRYDANDNLTRTIRYATRVTASDPANLDAARPAAAGDDRSTWNAYDAAGRLVKSVDSAGYVTQWFYDGAGRLTDVVRFATAIATASLGDAPAESAITPVSAAEDRHERSFYDAAGRLIATLDGEGYLVEHLYDGAGRLVETVAYATVTAAEYRAAGTLDELRPGISTPDIHTHTLYNARRQVTGVIDGEGYLTETVYDLAGNRTQVIRYSQKVTYVDGATVDSLRPAGDVHAQVTRFEYNEINQLIEEESFDGTVSEYAYDLDGNLVSLRRAVDTGDLRTVNAQYDRQGRLTAELSANGSALLNGATQEEIDAIWAEYAVKHTYDAAGRRTSTTDAEGNRTLFYYDADGRLVYAINAMGEVQASSYDAFGQLQATRRYGARIPAATLQTLAGGLVNAAVTDAISAIAIPAQHSVVTYEYDAVGNLKRTTDELGFTETRTYNAFGEAVAASRQIDAASYLEHAYAYDRRGLLKQTRWDPLGLNTSSATTYDAFGRAIETVDANGNIRKASYDKLGRTVETRDGLNALRQTTYDAFDRVLSQRDALGNEIRFEYDKDQRSITMRAWPENVVISTTFLNRHGQTIKVTDALGHDTTYEYDANGNLKKVTAPGAAVFTSEYDDADRLVETVDARGVRTAYAYDAAGRMVTRTIDPDGLALVTRFVYDAKGQAISTFDANGVETRTQYDAKGQVVSVTVDPHHLALKTTYAYDGRGRKLTVTEGAGTAQQRVRLYTYDKLGRLVSERVDPTGLNLTTSYAYDGNGNVVRKTDANGHVTRYVYDAEDRLVFVIDPLGGVTRTEYDAEGRTVRTIAYAAAINVASLPANPSVDDVVVASSPGQDRVTGSVYDRFGREIYAVDVLGGVVRKEYDANGNVVSRTAYATAIDPQTALTATGIESALQPNAADQTVRFFYDAANRPVYAIDALGALTASEYDKNGNLVRSIAFADPVPAGITQAQLDLLNRGAEENRIVRHVYDGANREVYRIDAEGYVKETRYDGLGRISQTIEYGTRIAIAGAAPTQSEVAQALGTVVAAGYTNQTSTQYANPLQPYAYAEGVGTNTASPGVEDVAVAQQTTQVYRDPTQPYAYLNTANNDVATPATQGVSVTSQSATVSSIQPYTYIAAATQDSAAPATQNVSLSIQNTSVTQSANVANYAWTRSGSTLVQTSGLSITPGSALYNDTSPTLVRAKIYQNGTLLSTTDTNVGWSSTESWQVATNWDEYGNPISWTWVSGTRWNKVSNWTGQVNLTTGALAAGQYTVTIETEDTAQAAKAANKLYDLTDGKWGTLSNTITINVGTVVQPTYVRWPTSTQPVGTASVTFQYRAAGSGGAYGTATVGTSGSDHEVNLGAVAAGDYEYVVEYRDTYGRLLKSASGTLTTVAGQTGSANATFNYTAYASSAAAGSSIRYFTQASQWAAVERIDAVVKDSSGAVVSTSVTYPEATAGYNGEVNLAVGAALANGEYTVELTLHNKDGSSTPVTPFTYETGPQTRIRHSLQWAANTQPAGTTATFQYRPQGGGAWTTAPVGASGANYEVVLDWIAAGSYEYAVEYRDSYDRLLKSASDVFTVASSGSSTATVDFDYTAYSSTPGAGSSISGYIPLADVPTIERVDAVVKDFVTGATVSSAVTYPEYESGYAGNVNLKVGSPLATGRYNVTVTVLRKDGTSTAATFYYEVGPQAVWYPTQPYAYVASARNDTATIVGQNVAISVSNATEFQSANVLNSSWYRSGTTLYQDTGSGMSITGAVTYGDATPTGVRAKIYQNGTLIRTVDTDVGYSQGESWQVWGVTQTDEYGNPTEYGWITQSGTRWNGAGNWTGQANLGAPLATGHYTVVLEAWDHAQSARANGAFYDYTDGTWGTYTNTVNIVVGTIAQPTVLSWAASTQPAGTNWVTFQYRAAGSSEEFQSATVQTNGANQQVSIAGLPDGNYEYRIEYKDTYSRVLKSSSGTFTSTRGGSSSVAATFEYREYASTASTGSSIRYFSAPAQWAPVDRVEATVKDAFGNVVSTAATWPEAEPSYSGEVNLKVGAPLADGRYFVELTVFNKDGTTSTVAPFLYEVGELARLEHVVRLPASTQPEGTTLLFKYRPQGSAGLWLTGTASIAGTNQEVLLDWLSAGDYEYTIEYRDAFDRVHKSAAGTFTVSAGASSTSNVEFSYITPGVGSSIAAYIPLAQVSTIDRVEAVVTDFETGATVSTALTYPELEELGPTGNVNLSTGAPLADGRYNVSLTIFRKDGTTSTDAFYYEVGLQAHTRRTTTVTWSAAGQPANTTAEFAYRLAGQSGTEVVVTPVLQDGIYSVTFTSTADDGVIAGLGDGIYNFVVRYKEGAQVVAEGSGQFTAASDSDGTIPLTFGTGGERVNTFAYDAAGWLIQSTDPLGHSESYAYDAVGNKISFTNKNGATWTYGYDAAGRLVDEFSPQVTVGTAAGAVENNVSLRTHIDYDDLGNVIARTEAYGRPEARTTEYEYDALGRQMRTVFPEVNVYDPTADVLTVNTGAAVSRTETSVELYSEVTYDTLGRAVVNRAADGGYSYKVYDPAGRLRYDIDAEDYVTAYEYDAFGNQTALIRYAARLPFGSHGQGTPWTLEEVEAALNEAGEKRRIESRYDANNRLIEVVEPETYVFDSVDNHGADASRRTLSEYDAFGSLVRQRTLSSIAANGSPIWADTRFYYNERGERVAQIDPEGYLTEWQYDAAGNVTRQTEYANRMPAEDWDPSGAASPAPGDAASGYDRIVAYGYDLANRRISETRVGARFHVHNGANGIAEASGDVITTFGYDAVGNLATTVDAEGAVTATTYDALGRTVGVTHPERLTADVTRGGVAATPVTTLLLDAFGKTVRQTNQAGGVQQVVSTVYDTHGNAIQTTDAEGNSKYFSYDRAGRLAKSWQAVTGDATQYQIKVLQYDKLGNQVATLDLSTRPNFHDVSHAAPVVHEEAVTYNAYGEITERRLNGTVAEYFEYDAAGRIWRTNQGDGVDKVYLYDVQGRNTAEIRSLTTDLRTAYANARAADENSRTADSAVRTETTYDLAGRVVRRELPAFGAIDPSVVGAPEAGWNTASVSSVTHDRWFGDIFKVYIAVKWPSFAGWGAGDVRIQVDAISEAGAVSLDQNVGAAIKSGTVFHFGRPITTVTRIRVSKMTTSGQWALVHDSNAPTARRITFASPTSQSGDYAVFSYRTPGNSEWTVTPLHNFGAQSMVDTSSWQDGTYEYQIEYFHADGTRYATGTGTLEVEGTSATVTPTGPQVTTVHPEIHQTVDRWGNVLSTTDPRNEAWITEYQYDDQNRLLRETKPEVSVHQEDGSFLATRPELENYYDRLGRVIGTRNANGSINTVRYNAAGQIIRETHADGGVVDRSYDGLGRMVGEWDERNNLTTRAYDLNNRLTRVTRPNGTYEEYQYDELGNRISERDGAGLVTTYRYDANGRVIRATKPGGAVTHTYYDLVGNKSKEVNALGHDQNWQYDIHGRKTSYSDLADVTTAYTYNSLGALTSATSSRATTSYTYGINGWLARIDNTASSPDGQGAWTERTDYAYDAAGNQIAETFTKNGETHLESVITYDALGRVTEVADERYNVKYTYDANGNRRRTQATYFDAAGAPTNKEYWYKYDSMNRIVLAKGAWDTNANAIVRGNEGVSLSYDMAGNRTVASTNSSTETYQYDSNGRLETVHLNGVIASRRYYDGSNNVVQLDSHNASGVRVSYQVNNYNANGFLTSQQSYKRLEQVSEYGTHVDIALSSNVTYTSRDALGQVQSYSVAVYDPEITEMGQDEAGNLTHVVNPRYFYTNTYTYTRVAYGDAYREYNVSGTSTYFQPGTTRTRYDGNGSIASVVDEFNGSNNRTFITDQSGRILRKTNSSSGQHEYYFYANGKPLGSTGLNGANDFDYNYTPVSDHYPAHTPSQHVVSPGETLRSIAQAMYGDAALWYLIADANGISSDAQLKVGASLTIPNKITNLHNNFETFKPYEPSEIIGDTTPTLPDPPPDDGGGCGVIGQIIVIVVTVVTAIVAPYALPATWGTLATAMATAAITNVATQFTANLVGLQDGFDFKSFAASVATAGIGHYASSLLPPGLSTAATRAVVNTVVGQGVRIAMGLQEKFSWRDVAASYVGAEIASNVAKTALDEMAIAGKEINPAREFLAHMAGGVAAGIVKAAIYRDGKLNLVEIAADAFGNMLGTELALKAARREEAAAFEEAINFWRDRSLAAAGGGSLHIEITGGMLPDDSPSRSPRRAPAENREIGMDVARSGIESGRWDVARTRELIQAARASKTAAEAEQARRLLDSARASIQAELRRSDLSERLRVELQGASRQLQQAGSMMGAKANSYRKTGLGILAGVSQSSMHAVLAPVELALQAPQLLSGLGRFITDPAGTTVAAYSSARTQLTESWEAASAASAAGEPGRAYQTYTQQALGVASATSVAGVRLIGSSHGTRIVTFGGGEAVYKIDEATGLTLRAEGVITGPHVGRGKGVLPEPVGGRMPGEHRGHLIPEGGVENPAYVNVAYNLISEAPASNLGLKKSFDLKASRIAAENPDSVVRFVSEPVRHAGESRPFAVTHYILVDGRVVEAVSIFNR